MKVTLIRCSGKACRQSRLSSKPLQISFERSIGNLDPPPPLAEALGALTANLHGPGSWARRIIAGKRSVSRAWQGEGEGTEKGKVSLQVQLHLVLGCISVAWKGQQSPGFSATEGCGAGSVLQTGGFPLPAMHYWGRTVPHYATATSLS